MGNNTSSLHDIPTTLIVYTDVEPDDIVALMLLLNERSKVHVELRPRLILVPVCGNAHRKAEVLKVTLLLSGFADEFNKSVFVAPGFSGLKSDVFREGHDILHRDLTVKWTDDQVRNAYAQEHEKDGIHRALFEFIESHLVGNIIDVLILTSAAPFMEHVLFRSNTMKGRLGRIFQMGGWFADREGILKLSFNSKMKLWGDDSSETLLATKKLYELYSSDPEELASRGFTGRLYLYPSQFMADVMRGYVNLKSCPRLITALEEAPAVSLTGVFRQTVVNWDTHIIGECFDEGLEVGIKFLERIGYLPEDSSDSDVTVIDKRYEMLRTHSNDAVAEMIKRLGVKIALRSLDVHRSFAGRQFTVSDLVTVDGYLTGGDNYQRLKVSIDLKEETATVADSDRSSMWIAMAVSAEDFEALKDKRRQQIFEKCEGIIRKFSSVIV